MRSNNTKPKKPYVLRTPDGSIAAGTLTYSFKKPKPGDWIEVLNENTEYRNPTSYTNTVRVTYPNAVSAQAFGEYTKKFLKNLGYSANNMVTSISACSDDLNGPNFVDYDNIGQGPNSVNEFLGPFYSGGLAGYPHTGITGLGAFASHATDTGALFVINMPHIGISNSGVVGQSIRRGQTTLNTSCGAVLAAVTWVGANAGLPTFPSVAFPDNDYQQFYLTNILASTTNRALLAAATGTPAKMVVATEIIRVAGETFLIGSTGIQAIGGLIKDVFFCSGIFVNVDDGYEAYISINTFKKWTTTGVGTGAWTDLTTTFKAGLPN